MLHVVLVLVLVPPCLVLEVLTRDSLLILLLILHDKKSLVGQRNCKTYLQHYKILERSRIKDGGS